MIELMIVVLFFGILTSIVAQMLTSAVKTSRASTARSEALIAVTDMVERLKADPAEGCFQDTVNGVAVTAEVTAEHSDVGTLYTITAASADADPVSVTTARYIKEAGS
jgi:hypothetical protein